MSGTIFRVVYCSRVRPGMTIDLPAILEISRRNNARDGITGALMSCGGGFAQALEGPLDAVQRTFERIQCDPRHSDVVVLEARSVDERLFGKWDMALAAEGGILALAEVIRHALREPDGASGAALIGSLQELVRVKADQSAAAPRRNRIPA